MKFSKLSHQDTTGTPKNLSDVVWAAIVSPPSAQISAFSFGGSRPAPTAGVPFVAIP